MSLNSNALTTVARQKAFLSENTTAYDSLIESLINSASSVIETYLDRKLARAARTNEEYSGSGGPTLHLSAYPVDSSQTFSLGVRDSYANESSWSTIDSEDYFVDYTAGMVKKVSGVFAKEPYHYRVTYTAGYYLPQDNDFGTTESKDLPTDIELACWLLVSKIHNQMRRQGSGVSSVSLEGASVQLQQNLLLDSQIKSLLDEHKNLA